MTNLPEDAVDRAKIVKSYFERWPCQETQFKNLKKTASLHRVAGYGKKKSENKIVQEKQDNLLKKINQQKKELSEIIERIEQHEEIITKLISEKRHHSAKCHIDEGKLNGPLSDVNKLMELESEIKSHARLIKKIEKENDSGYKTYKINQKEWFRLQGKENESVADVELDQIMTFHRLCLANLYAYFLRFFIRTTMSNTTLLHSILHLPAEITETLTERTVKLKENKQDKTVMNLLRQAIVKLNKLKIAGPTGKTMIFELE